MKVTILGCGPSWGVPPIGGNWGECDPANPRNRRLRASILVEDKGKTILIDASPDMRAQLLSAGATRIDAVLFTHAHADHLHGIDDLRSVNRMMQGAIPIYGNAQTLADIKQRFGYVFTPYKTGIGETYYKPLLDPVTIDGPFDVGGIHIVPFVQSHGFSESLGFRFGKFAYSTDVFEFDEAAFQTLAGVEIWVVDCIRRKPHRTHSHVEKTLDWISRVRPRIAVLTHMDESLDYETLRSELPKGVEPGYDGMILEVD